MHSIQIGKITRQYPSQISEMTTEQYITFSGLVLQYQTHQLSWLDFSKELSYALLNMKRRVNIKTHTQAEKITYNLNQIYKLNEYFFTEKKGNKVIKTDFVNNLIPKIKVGKEWYYGPNEALVNTVFGEYTIALNYFNDFSLHGDEKDLDSMIATIYRPINRMRKKLQYDDIREPFDKDAINRYRNKIKKIPSDIKYGIYLWFASCQKFIITCSSLPVSGGESIDLSVLFKGKSNEKGIGMAGVIYSIAESHVFGDADKVAMQNTYDVLIRMVQTYLQAKKIKSNDTN